MRASGSCAQSVCGVMQSMCLRGRKEWAAIREECKEGSFQVPLVDMEVEAAAGFGDFDASLMDVEQLGKSWMGMVVTTAELLSYDPRKKDEWEGLMKAWKITHPGHYLCQKQGESVMDVLLRMRKSVKQLRKQLRKMNKLHKLDQEVSTNFSANFFEPKIACLRNPSLK